uniref:phage tail tape measure protein n=1 Tax=Aliarcobacter sp. TaxID=2321116 RepID=UPI004047D869
MSTLLNIGIILSATDALSPVFKGASSEVDGFATKAKNASADLTKLGTATLAIGEGITSTLGSFVNDFQEIRAVQGELKTLGVVSEGIDAITASAKEFSNQFSGTTTSDFISASYDIKSGISSLSDTAVGEFTAISALTGKATKSSTDQMTSLFASGYGIYRKQFESFGSSTIAGWNKLSAEEKDIKFGEYFSAGISNSVQAFKTDGSQMSAAISNLGATATSAGIDFAEQLTILGQLQATMSGSEAATKYRAFLGSVSGAGDKLDLQFTDANNQLLSMPVIIEKIKDKYGSTIDAIEADELKKAFGTEEAVGLIKLMYDETDTLTDNINKMNSSLQEGTKKTKMMALAANEGKEQDLLNQKISNLTATIGSRFAPVVLFATDVIGNVVEGVTSWMDEHETLSTVIISGIGIIGGLLTVLGTVGVVAGGVGMVLPLLSGGFGLVTASMGVMAAATKVVTAAFVSNPIGFIAAGIATAAYLIYDNWEPIGEFFTNLWSGIKETAAPVLEWMSNGLSTVSSFFGFGSDKKDENSTAPMAKTQGAKDLQAEVLSSPVSPNHNMIYQNKQDSSSRVIKNEPTYNITVSNPNSDVDVQRAIKDMERRNRNKTYEDLD